MKRRHRKHGKRTGRLAVALEYEPDAMEAPQRTLTGSQEMADAMNRLAVRYGIPIVDQPELTAALHEGQPGEPIDPELYQQIADVFIRLEHERPEGMVSAVRGPLRWSTSCLPREFCRK